LSPLLSSPFQAGCSDSSSVPGGYSCAQQKAWGKCSESWLKDACAKTCGLCKSGLEVAAGADAAEQDTLIAGMAAKAKLAKNGTWLWKKNLTKFSLEPEASTEGATDGVDAAVDSAANDETLLAGAVAAKLMAMKKNSTFWKSKFNKTKYAAEDVDAVESAEDADTLIAGLAIASKLAKKNKTGLWATKFNKTAYKFSADEATTDSAEDEFLISGAIDKVLRLKNATRAAIVAKKNMTKWASEEAVTELPDFEASDYHLVKTFNKTWGAGVLATKFNATKNAIVAAKNATKSG
jgi:hypothetical protein